MRTSAPAHRVIDYGCGSGILGIAAARLGASACRGLRHRSAGAAGDRENAAANGVAGQLAICADAGASAARRSTCWWPTSSPAPVRAGARGSRAWCAAAGRSCWPASSRSRQKPWRRLMLRGLISHHAARRDGWVALRGQQKVAMFTVCPKCTLTLAVTAADLRAGQGYVRCGRCANVFNALLRSDRGASRWPDGAAARPHDRCDRTGECTVPRHGVLRTVAVPNPAGADRRRARRSRHDRDLGRVYDPESPTPKIRIAPLPLTPPAPAALEAGAGHAADRPPAAPADLRTWRWMRPGG